jgi:hypothetical protein
MFFRNFLAFLLFDIDGKPHDRGNTDANQQVNRVKLAAF